MNEDLVIQKIIKLEEDVAFLKEKIVKVDMLDELMVGQDKMIKILERLDDERVLMNDRITYLEKDVTMIKDHLHLV